MEKENQKTYSELAKEMVVALNDAEQNLIKGGCTANEVTVSMLTAITHELAAINVTLSGIADYYIRCEKKSSSGDDSNNFVETEVTPENVDEIIERLKRIKEVQNGKD